MLWRTRGIGLGGIGTRVAVTAGLALLTVAVGQPSINWPSDPAEVVVMVDLSPSTRGATFREPDRLQQRLTDLLGDRPFRLYYFASVPETATIPPTGQPLPDLPADRTTFTPPATADAVLVFTDGQFTLPSVAAPIFPIVDPALDQPIDARVASLAIRDDSLHAGVTNTGPPASLDWLKLSPSATTTVASGQYVINAPIPADATTVGVRINSTDRWPENDTMLITSPPPAELQRWWIGESSPNAPWVSLSARSLPTEPARMLKAATIVLNNVPADALSPAQLAALDIYVKQAGGTVILLGGDRAFAAGGYRGTALDALSPLASDPPTPTIEWTILTDASGSMAADAPGGGTRFHATVNAVRAALRGLPQADILTIGSFARDVRWWSTGRPVSETVATFAVPVDLVPNGPTNLSAAIDAITNGVGAQQTRQIVLITDGGAEPLDVPTVSERLKASGSTLSVLAIGTGPASESLRQIASATGGSSLTETDVTQWQQAASQLARNVTPDRLERTPVALRFSDVLSPMGRATTSGPWNRTWLRTNATLAASALTDTAEPMAAWWNVGAGRVASIAFAVDSTIATDVAQRLSIPPSDPRFAVTWQDEPAGVRVTIDATDSDGQPLNGLAPVLSLSGYHPVPQTAPGRYEFALTAPRDPTIALVMLDGQPLARRAFSGHYPAEFAAIGNDYATLRTLAARTGGRVIWPNESQRLELPRRTRSTSNAGLFAMCGAVALAVGLVAWRRR